MPDRLADESVYEIQITVRDGDDSDCYYIDHRLAALPETETLVALKREAEATFAALFPGSEPTAVAVRAIYLAADERATAPHPPQQAEAAPQ